MKKTKHIAHRPRGRRPHKKSVRGLAIAGITVLSVTAMLLIGAGTYAWMLFSRANYNPDDSLDFVDSLPPDDDPSGDLISDYADIEKGAASVAEIPVRGNTKNITNILLIGVDSRQEKSLSGLADSIIILTIDSKGKALKLTSLLRDTLVTIPGRDRNRDGKDDYDKLNSAYAYGGFDLLSQTIEQNFRLRISKYIVTNFSAFSDAVDHVGGVDIALTADEARLLEIGNTAKTYHLDGYHALEYSRIREIGNDFARTGRQRRVLGCMFQQAKDMNLGKLNNMLFDMMEKMGTNMSQNELMGFTANSFTYFGYSMDKALQFPPNNAYVGGSVEGVGSVLRLTDPADSVTDLHQFIYMES